MPTSPKIRPLSSGYTSEVDVVDERRWHAILEEFDDANIYQTWSYGDVITGRRNLSHLILRADGQIVAAAQARISKLPILNVGIAYVRWGPVWRCRTAEANSEVFCQAVRALRNEFVCKRGLALRLFPVLFDDDPPSFAAILEEEGFSFSERETRTNTILMDLTRSLPDVRESLRPHWKRELKVAERKGLEIIEGTDDRLFATMVDIHREMVSRKHFAEGNDINQFRLIQARLPENLKMKILLGQSQMGVCAGLVYSVLGRTAIYLFGATSNIGMKSNGSYLLQWHLIQRLKEAGVAVYDLNGINPVRNPGTYKFKSDLAGRHGREVCFLGRFDSHAGPLSYSCVRCGELLRAIHRRVKQTVRRSPRVRLWLREAQ